MATSYIKGNGLTQDGTSGVDRLQYNCGAVLPERALTYWLEWEDFNTKDKGYVVFVTDKFGNVQSLNGDRVGNFFYKGNKVYVETSDIRIQYKMGPNVMWKVEDKPAGTTGITKASSEVTSGAGTPPTNGQYLGQLYVNTSTGDVYAYKTGGWVKCAGDAVLPSSTTSDVARELVVQDDGTPAWANPYNGTGVSRFFRMTRTAPVSAGAIVPLQRINATAISAAVNCPVDITVSISAYGDSTERYDVTGWKVGSNRKLFVRQSRSNTGKANGCKFYLVRTDADGTMNETDGTYIDVCMKLPSNYASNGNITVSIYNIQSLRASIASAGVALTKYSILNGTYPYAVWTATSEQLASMEASNSVKYSVGVPVTTSSDAGKVLSVDANGNNTWVVDSVSYRLSSNVGTNANGYIICPLCKIHKPASASTHGRFHVDGRMSLGSYNYTMACGLFDITGTWDGSTVGSLGVPIANGCLTIPYSKSTRAEEQYGTSHAYKHVKPYLGYKILSDGDAQLYVLVQAVDTYRTPAVVLSGMYYDDTLYAFENGDHVIPHSEYASTWPSDITQLGIVDMYVPMPLPTTSDNGKVLKVVNGMPAWVNA